MFDLCSVPIVDNRVTDELTLYYDRTWLAVVGCSKPRWQNAADAGAYLEFGLVYCVHFDPSPTMCGVKLYIIGHVWSDQCLLLLCVVSVAPSSSSSSIAASSSAVATTTDKDKDVICID